MYYSMLTVSNSQHTVLYDFVMVESLFIMGFFGLSRTWQICLYGFSYLSIIGNHDSNVVCSLPAHIVVLKFVFAKILNQKLNTKSSSRQKVCLCLLLTFIYQYNIVCIMCKKTQQKHECKYNYYTFVNTSRRINSCRNCYCSSCAVLIHST